MVSRCAYKVGLCALVICRGPGAVPESGWELGETGIVSVNSKPPPLFAAALRAWSGCNEYMPSRVIVYRDGVGDGQLKTLVNYEVPQFLDCLKSVGRGYK